MQRAAKLNIPGVARVPKDLRIISTSGKQVQAIRHDGLTIFLDRQSDEASRVLNRIRLFAPADQVIHAVGLFRGFQVSIAYAKRYRPEGAAILEQEFTQFIDRLNARRLPLKPSVSLR